MTDDDKDHTQMISRKAHRLERARKRRSTNAWYGLSMFGMIGWAIAVPTVVGIAIGLYIDARWPGEISWALTLLLAGVCFGCFNAWYWVQREGRNDD